MPRKPQDPKQQLFVFTINNPHKWEAMYDGVLDDALASLVLCQRKLTYIGFEHEIGENGTPHIQGFFRTKTQTRYSKGELQKWEGLETAWIKPMKGSVKQNVDYCSKDDNFIEFGIRPQAGARSDLNHLYKAIKKGQSDRELLDNGHFPTWSRSLKAVDRVRGLYRPKANQRKIILHYGPTNVGKTYTCFKDHPDLFEIPISKKGDLWFDGYDGEDVCLIDEFSGQMPLNALLKIIDIDYVRRVPTKGSHVWWNPKIVYISTNIHPCKWYNWDNRVEQQAALRRRFEKIYVFQEKYKDPEDVNIKEWWPLTIDFIEEDANPVPISQCLLDEVQLLL